MKLDQRCVLRTLRKTM